MAKNPPGDQSEQQPPAEQPIVKPAEEQQPEVAQVHGAIEVLYGYRGEPSGEKYIEPGKYAVDDPALLGLGQYLVDNGHAREV